MPAPWHPYFPGDEWAQEVHAVQARRGQQAARRHRPRQEGRRRGSGCCRTASRSCIELSVGAGFAAWPDVAQLIAKDWEKVGVKTVVQIRERALHFKMRDANELQTEMWNEDTTAFPFTGNAKVDVRNNADPDHRAALQPVVRHQGQGRRGAAGADQEDRRSSSTRRGRSGPTVRSKAAQEIFRIWADKVYEIGTDRAHPDGPGRGRGQRHSFRNVPTTLGNDWPLRSPGNARPEQFFYTK